MVQSTGSSSPALAEGRTLIGEIPFLFSIFLLHLSGTEQVKAVKGGLASADKVVQRRRPGALLTALQHGA
jgi:hypothetical protein